MREGKETIVCQAWWLHILCPYGDPVKCLLGPWLCGEDGGHLRGQMILQQPVVKPAGSAVQTSQVSVCSLACSQLWKTDRWSYLEEKREDIENQRAVKVKDGIG